MTRETAITEEISYSTSRCKLCGSEVAMDEVPEDVVERQGYVVLLGEGSITREIENSGNWDQEIQFELEDEESRLPNVSAYLVCEDCAEAVHGTSSDISPYTGKIPSELAEGHDQNLRGMDVPNWAIYLLGIILFLILLSILL